jgi:hypothetical protein
MRSATVLHPLGATSRAASAWRVNHRGTLPSTSRMPGVGLDGTRRIWPAHVGSLVGPDGSRRKQSDRLDDHRDDQEAPTQNRMTAIAVRAAQVALPRHRVRVRQRDCACRWICQHGREPIALPAGRLVWPDPQYRSRASTVTRPAYWLSDGSVTATLWTRLRAKHGRSGLWPLLLEGLDGEPARPWVGGDGGMVDGPCQLLRSGVTAGCGPAELGGPVRGPAAMTRPAHGRTTSARQLADSGRKADLVRAAHLAGRPNSPGE